MTFKTGEPEMMMAVEDDVLLMQSLSVVMIGGEDSVRALGNCDWW